MFFQEILLSLYIIFNLIYICYVKINHENFINQNKKHFFILLNYGILTLILIFFLNFSFIVFDREVSDTIYDNLAYFSVLNQVVAEHFGIEFFRLDAVTFALNMFLSFIFIIYFFIVKQIFKTTNLAYKYLGEIPLLLILLFFSLHLFLLTYDLVLIVLALELAAFCSILLIGLHVSTKKNVFTLEAAIKYFIFSALAGLLLLFAISGYYYYFQTLNMFDFKFVLLTNTSQELYQAEILIFLHFLFFSSFCFKLGAAPFHYWVPDVYEGADLLITTFLVLIISPTVCCKFFLFVKILLPTFELNYSISLLLCWLGVFSIIIGSFKAYQQYKLKRFLAYTSIIHLGYILLSLSTGSQLGFLASFLYLFIYVLTNILLFGLLLIVRQPTQFSLIFLTHLKMVLSNNISLVLLFLIPFFSFAGFPPFLGFFTKFAVLLSLIDFQRLFLTLCLVFYIVLNSFLYLRFAKLTLFEKNFGFLFLPILPGQTFIKLEYTLAGKREIKIDNNLILLIFFSLSFSLTLGCLILPSLLTILLKPVMVLCLYY